MINRIVRAVAGTFILLSVLLAVYVNPNWLWFTAFVGANLLQSSFTKWCLLKTSCVKGLKSKSKFIRLRADFFWSNSAGLTILFLINLR